MCTLYVNTGCGDSHLAFFESAKPPQCDYNREGKEKDRRADGPETARGGGAHSISSLTQRQPRSAARGGTDAHTHHIYSILSLYWNRILLEEP